MRRQGGARARPPRESEHCRGGPARRSTGTLRATHSRQDAMLPTLQAAPRSTQFSFRPRLTTRNDPTRPTRTYSCEPLPLRRPELGPALAAFAEGKLSGAGEYVAARLGVYDAVIVADNGAEVAAF